MKGRSIYSDINQAKNHINKLKLQLDQLDLIEDNTKINQYVNQALYSLCKNDNNINKKKKQIVIEKYKLPFLNKKYESVNNQYKKVKKNYYRAFINKDQSTKISSDPNISLQIENRPAKMHSVIEKVHKPQILLQPTPLTNAPNPIAASLRRQRFKAIQAKNGPRSLKFIDITDSMREFKKGGNLREQMPVEYDQIVDKYSNHTFMIIKGKIADEGPQFASYRRVYQSIFPRIISCITQIELLLQKFSIDFAHLDGKKLAYLCLQDRITVAEFVGCLVEGEQLASIIVSPPKFDEETAASRIAAFWKMKQLRDKYLQLKKKTIDLQRYFKRHLMKIETQKKIRKRAEDLVNKFQERQQRLAKEWKEIRNQKRVQIHINSIEVDEEKRLTIENYPERQNIQLSRIFRIKDQNLIIIMVTPYQLPLELTNYYYKMLQIAGIPKLRDRIFFIHPEASYKFPSHYPTSKLLYYSSCTLRHLRNITNQLPTIIYPGHPSNQLIKICNELNCFLYSNDPQRMKQLMTKSQTKRLLNNLSLSTLPGAIQMYDYGEFINTFAVLILKNPQIKVWILKIDDEFASRGLAYFDIEKCKLIKSVLLQVVAQESQLFTTDPNADPNNQQATLRIRDNLKAILKNRLTIVTPTLYRTYEQFMGRFIKKGGIIEAQPPCGRQKLRYPSVSFSLEPTGQWKIITTYQKIIGQPYRTVACKFPQNLICNEQFLSIIRQIVESYKLRKMFGDFTIDLVTYVKEKHNQGNEENRNSRLNSKSWIIGIDPYINNYTSIYYNFDLMMNGVYFPQKYSYMIQRQIKQQNKEQRIRELSQRSYIYIPYIYCSGLNKISIRQFFKQARIQLFNFNIYERQGICIMLLDQLSSGMLSLFSVNQFNVQNQYQILRFLQFISKISKNNNVNYGNSFLNPANDTITLKEVISVFTGYNRKQKRTNSKQKAIRKFQMNANLQLL